jgi:LysM repeat protein
MGMTKNYSYAKQSLLKGTLLIVAFLMSFYSFAQPENAVKETIEGKEYYIHTVESGNTLYSIHRLYKVPVDLLVQYNPTATSGLQIGQKIKIPVKKVEATTAAINTPPDAENGKYLIHKVEGGETVYGISRKFGVSIDEVLEANPAARQGIKPGNELRIPNPEWDPTAVVDTPPVDTTEVAVVDSVPVVDNRKRHTVKKKETFYSISKQYDVSIEDIKAVNGGLADGLKKGMEIIIPEKTEIVHSLTVDTASVVDTMPQVVLDTNIHKEVYNIAVMLPFMLAKNDWKRANLKVGEEFELYHTTELSINLYRGIKLAVDSLKGAGLSVNLHSYDTVKDSEKVAEILGKPEMKTMDMIIGPLYSGPTATVSKFAKENGIHMVCPVSMNNKLLLDNPHVSKVISSTPTQVKALADHVVEKYHSDNVIVLNSKVSKEAYYLSLFEEHYNGKVMAYDSLYRDSVLVSELGYKARTIQGQMVADRINVIVVPSSDISYVSNVLTKLNSMVSSSRGFEDYQFKVFGLESWFKFDRIDVNYKHRLNVHLASTTFIDYDTLRTNLFIQRYRDKYNYDPEKYAFMGFDASYYYLSALKLFGSQWAENLHRTGVEPIHTEFNMVRTREGSGFENKNVYILKYEDYSLVPQN